MRFGFGLIGLGLIADFQAKAIQAMTNGTLRMVISQPAESK